VAAAHSADTVRVRSDDDGPGVTVELPRFGACRYRECDVLAFPWGLPGFSALRRFLPLDAGTGDGRVWLQSLDDLTVLLPTAAARHAAGDLASLPSYARESLALDDGAEWVTLSVISTEAPGPPAPIVVNLRTRTARQVVLETHTPAAERTLPALAAGG
jgi:flagellar assembly factor FliW